MTAADFLCSTCHCERGSNRSGCGGCASEPSVPPPTPADLDEAAIVADARAAERRDVVAWLRRSALLMPTGVGQAVLEEAAHNIERRNAPSFLIGLTNAHDPGAVAAGRQAERDAITATLRARADRVRAVARDAIGGGVKAILDEAERLDAVAYLISRGVL